MIVLHDDHEFSSVLGVRILASITDVGLELQVWDLKLNEEVNALSPVPVAYITRLELITIAVWTHDIEVTSERWGGILEGGLNRDSRSCSLCRDNRGHRERRSIDLLCDRNSVHCLDNCVRV